MWTVSLTRSSYVLLAQYLSPVDACIEAGLLKSEGIDTLLLDEIWYGITGYIHWQSAV